MTSDSFFDNLKINLTSKQKDAVKCPLGPVIVHAGAGSGKTSVIAYRFIYLVQHFKINPERILLVTFTNKAVRNIQGKIKNYLLERNWNNMSIQQMEHIHNNIQAMTFHGVCKRILEWVYEKKDKPAAKKFVFDSQFFSTVKEVLKEYPNIRAAYRVKDILVRLRKICKLHNREFTEDELVSVAMNVDVIYEREKILQKYPYEVMKEIYEKFDILMKKKKQGTLDDILLDTNTYLKDESIAKEWSSRYDAILCDEFQDVDEMQFNVLTTLSSNDNNLFCVGDPSQTIYGFRGAMPHVFMALKKHFVEKGVKVEWKQLPQNFRSTPQILSVANALMNVPQVPEELKNPLSTKRPDGSVPTLQILSSDGDQARIVASKIIELKKQGVALSEIAILGRKRSNYQKVKYEFLAQQIHYEDYREMMPLIKSEAIKDLVSWISISFVRDDDKWLSFFQRISSRPKSGVGPVTIQKISQLFKERQGGIEEVIKELSESNEKLMMLHWKIKKLKSIADDESMSLIERYRTIAQDSGIVAYHSKKSKDPDKSDAIEKFLSSPMVSEAESWNDALIQVENYLNVANQERVVCSTIHGVKGMEFKYVFLLSLSEGHIPTSRGLRLCKNEEMKNAYIEDERRVLYVAITRAKDYLYMFTDSETPSQFLDDIQPALTGVLPEVSEEEREKHVIEEMLQISDDDDVGSEDETPTDVL